VEETCRSLTSRPSRGSSRPQKRELIEKLTDATASVYGEGIRQVTWVVIEDVNSGEWGIAGKPATTTDIKELLQAGQKATAGS
jgi:4-oxalocrotonate tautomerase